MNRALPFALGFTFIAALCTAPAGAQFSAAGAGSGVPAESPGGAPILLQIDDGTAEDAIGLTNGGQFLWLNRFTPASFPFELQEVHVMFTTAGNVSVGQLFDVYVYSDTDGDGNPATGSALLGSETNVAIAVIDAFTVVTLDPPILVSGPGDLLLAVANETAGVAAGTFPAAIDTTASQVRSWVGFGAQPLPDPPTLPLATFGTIDSFGFPGNWMIRGVGAPPAFEYPLIQEIPTLGKAGLAALLVLLGGTAFYLIARRRSA